MVYSYGFKKLIRIRAINRCKIIGSYCNFKLKDLNYKHDGKTCHVWESLRML